MFEGFTTTAREVVVRAQGEARELADPRIGTEHFLLALLDERAPIASTVLRRLGVDAADVRKGVSQGTTGLVSYADAEALKSIGIDVDAVLARLVERFGDQVLSDARSRGGRTGPPRGHIPLTRSGRDALASACDPPTAAVAVDCPGHPSAWHDRHQPGRPGNRRRPRTRSPPCAVCPAFSRALGTRAAPVRHARPASVGGTGPAPVDRLARWLTDLLAPAHLRDADRARGRGDRGRGRPRSAVGCAHHLVRPREFLSPSWFSACVSTGGATFTCATGASVWCR